MVKSGVEHVSLMKITATILKSENLDVLENEIDFFLFYFLI